MSKSVAGDYIFFRGKKYQVEFYCDEKGRMPAKEYFDKADKSGKYKLIALVEYLTDEGKLYDKTKYRIVDDAEKIFEFKPKHDRFFNFFYKGGKIILTNAYRKKTQKVDKKELRKAIKMKQDYEKREKGGIYYEKTKK